MNSAQIVPSMIFEKNRPSQEKHMLASNGTFSDHMATIRYTTGKGWGDIQIRPYSFFTMPPGSVALHYAQLIFEGLRAFRQTDGTVLLFRPEMNAYRLNQSARRLAMPELPEKKILDAINIFITKSHSYVTKDTPQSFYIRLFMFPLDESIALKPADDYLFCIISIPIESHDNSQCISVWICDRFSRTSLGGTGSIKCAANYAATMAAQKEATEHDCQQVLFLDSAYGQYVEEINGMNIFFVEKNGTVIAPPLSETILPGITRDSILTLMRDDNIAIEERPCQIEEILRKIKCEEIIEVFACGAALKTISIAKFRNDCGDFMVGDGLSPGKLCQYFSKKLTDIQYGRTKDPYGWSQKIF